MYWAGNWIDWLYRYDPNGRGHVRALHIQLCGLLLTNFISLKIDNDVHSEHGSHFPTKHFYKKYANMLWLCHLSCCISLPLSLEDCVVFVVQRILTQWHCTKKCNRRSLIPNPCSTYGHWCILWTRRNKLETNMCLKTWTGMAIKIILTDSGEGLAPLKNKPDGHACFHQVVSTTTSLLLFFGLNFKCLQN